MRPEDLRRKAAELDAEGEAALDAGDKVAALELFARAEIRRAVADEMERKVLPFGKSTANVSEDMTHAQLARRGRGIAKGKAAGDHRKEALVLRYGSLAKAAKELGTTPQSLSGYLGGLYPCPERLAHRVERETGLPPDSRTWPKGTVK